MVVSCSKAREAARHPPPIPRPDAGLKCSETDATYPTFPAATMRLGSKVYPTFIAVRIRILHVPGRSPGDIFTEVRATTLSAISMPAEMPADVSTRPSSTTCFWNSTITSGKASRIQCQRSPVSGCVQSVQQPGESQQHRSGTNRSQCFDFRCASAQPFKHGRVVQFLARAPAPGYNKDMQGEDSSQRCNVE